MILKKKPDSPEKSYLCETGKFERLIPKAMIIVIVVLMSIYSLKFFSLLFDRLGIPFPITLDHKWWWPPRNLFVYSSLLLFFLLTFLFRRAINLKTKSMLFGFFASLLFEMYGFSLSLYLLYVALGRTRILKPYVNYTFHRTLLPHLIRFPVLAISWCLGILLVMKGWAKIWNSRGVLVTDGIYAYLRHPQYLGLIYNISR